MSKKEMERMALSFAIHESDLEAGTFGGLAAAFNTMIDTWVPTRIKAGAFAKTLADNAQKARVKILYQHNYDWPIGIPVTMEENSDGLLVKGKISQTQQGKDVIMLMKDKVLTEMSIGFDPIRHEMVDEGIAVGQVRHITEIRLWEFSPVTFGANPDAKINSVHSLFQSLRAGADVPLTADTQRFLHALFEKMRTLTDAEPTDLMGLVTHLAQESHVGKVLSAKNKQLVQECRDSLQKLLDAAEPSTDDDESAVNSLTALNEKMRSLDLLTLGALAPRP